MWKVLSKVIRRINHQPRIKLVKSQKIYTFRNKLYFLMNTCINYYIVIIDSTYSNLQGIFIKKILIDFHFHFISIF